MRKSLGRLRFHTGVAIGFLAWALTPGGSSASPAPGPGDHPSFTGGSRFSLPRNDNVSLWWALSSSTKIRPDLAAPAQAQTLTQGSPGMRLYCAANETEAVQLVISPMDRKPLRGVRISVSDLKGQGAGVIAASHVEVLRVMYLDVKDASDRSSKTGLWPDPLLPLDGPVELKAGVNNVFWVRLHVPRGTPGDQYQGFIELQAAEGWRHKIALDVHVFGFELPDRMTCTTAFGFSPGNVFRYHGLTNEAQKRAVLEKYWANLAAHHVSPYDPAPLDPIRVRWPDARPPKTGWEDWSGLRIVENETRSGSGALLIYDDRVNENVSAVYEPLIRIPAKGLKIRCWYRTALPGHRFMVSLNHFDKNKKWMSGRNNDITLNGNGKWQSIEERLTSFPPGAEFVRFHARATTWTEAGEQVGLVWMDDVSIVDGDTGAELMRGGNFEKARRTAPVAPLEQLKPQLDFTAWDKAMGRAIGKHYFNSFRMHIPGIGGGTFHALDGPNLLGFGEDTPEYPVLFDSYCRQLEGHLAAKGWLDKAYIYWFDEPSRDQYGFVMNGFRKLKQSCPGIARMLTEQVEPELLGGPNIWCSLTDGYDHERAEGRRKHGEKFWWYVCTGPKAPYAGLFIDHPAPEMRVWLWQTFQRNVEGVLVWETTYWTSSAAYPDRKQPQNPYSDPMSWTSGYSTPDGKRIPWGNGDGRFIYPPLAAAEGKTHTPAMDGPVDSIRWEHLRDGIEDYEYLCILRKQLAAHKGSLASESHERWSKLLIVPESISRSLTEFAQDGAPIEAHRILVARAIEEINKSQRRE